MEPILKRAEGLLCQPVGEDLLIYDTARHTCHRLGAEARYIWDLLDHKLALRDIIPRFAEKYPQHGKAGKEFIEATLSDLSSKELLAERLSIAPAKPGRRKLLKGMGLLMVGTVVAPLPAAASSSPLTIVSAKYLGVDTGTTTAMLCGAASHGCQPGLDITTFLQSQISGNAFTSTVCNSRPLPVILAQDRGRNATLHIAAKECKRLFESAKIRLLLYLPAFSFLSRFSATHL